MRFWTAKKVTRKARRQKRRPQAPRKAAPERRDLALELNHFLMGVRRFDIGNGER